MEEMHRTHKEPVWGWVAVVADLIARAHRARIRREARRPALGAQRPAPKTSSVVTPWSPRSPAGWSA